MRHLNPKSVILTLSLLSLLLSGSAGALGDAEFPKPDGFQPGERMLARLTQQLDLSEEQQADIEKIVADGQEQRIEQRKQLRRLQHDLEGEMMADRISETRVMGLIEEIGAVRIEQQKNRMMQKLAIRELLTPEQRDRLMLQHDGERGFGGRGPGSHGQFGPGHGSSPHGCSGKGGCTGHQQGRQGGFPGCNQQRGPKSMQSNSDHDG
ncbi:MAG: Spy/CpxP family protein refolding chaperone [bacterium]